MEKCTKCKQYSLMKTNQHLELQSKLAVKNRNSNTEGFLQANSNFFEQWAVKNDHNDVKNDYYRTAQIINRAIRKYAYGAMDYALHFASYTYTGLAICFGLPSY